MNIQPIGVNNNFYNVNNNRNNATAPSFQHLRIISKEHWDKDILDAVCENKEIKKFIEVCEDKTPNQVKLNKILMIVLPAILIAVLALCLIGINRAFYFNVLKLVIIINLLLAFLNMQKSTSILLPIGDFYKNIKVYENIFKEIQPKLNFNINYKLLTKNYKLVKNNV